MDQFDTYYLSNGMLYTNKRTFLLQERGHERKENVIYITEPKSFNKKTLQFPLVSNNHIIKLVQEDLDNSNNEVYICPPYNSNKVPIFYEYNGGLEWFSSDDKENVIRVMRNGYLDLTVTLNTPYGVLLDKKRVHDKDKDPIVVPSQDGRYILVYNQGDVNSETSESPSIEWRVYQIKIISATQSACSEIDENEERKAEPPDEYDKIDSEVPNKKKPVLDVRMISEGTIETIVEGHLINEIKVAVLNNGNFIAFHLESCTFRYNNEDMYRKIKSNIEKYSQIFERNEELEGYKVDDVKIGQDFVILKFQKALLSFRFKEDPEENDFIYDFKKLKVPIATYYEGVSLNDIIITSHPTKILLNYTFELRGRNMKKNNIIIWDIDTDEEFSSFTPRDNDVFLFYLYCPIRQVRESIAYHASQGKKGTGKKSNNEQKEPRKEIYEV